MFGVEIHTHDREAVCLMQIVCDLVRYKDRVTIIRLDHLFLAMAQYDESDVGKFLLARIEPERLKLVVKNLGRTPSGDRREELTTVRAPRLSSGVQQVLLWDSVHLKYDAASESDRVGLPHVLAATLRVPDRRFRLFLKEQLGVDRRKLLREITFGSDLQETLSDMGWMNSVPTESLEGLLGFLRCMRVVIAEGETPPVIDTVSVPCTCDGDTTECIKGEIAYRQELKDVILWYVARLAPWVRPLLPTVICELTHFSHPPIDVQLRRLVESQ